VSLSVESKPSTLEQPTHPPAELENVSGALPAFPTRAKADPFPSSQEAPTPTRASTCVKHRQPPRGCPPFFLGPRRGHFVLVLGNPNCLPLTLVFFWSSPPPSAVPRKVCLTPHGPPCPPPCLPPWCSRPLSPRGPR